MTTSESTTSSERIWSVPVRVDEIPAGGRSFALHPDASTREALARAAGLLGLARLDATFDLTRHGRDGVRVTGTVSARVRQACVVTLDPVENDIEEDIDLVFVPAREAAATDTPASHEVLADAADPPEPLIGGAVDLGAIATEFLILGIDPYPRKPDAAFAAPSAGDAPAHPFAALAALNKAKGEGGK